SSSFRRFRSPVPFSASLCRLLLPLFRAGPLLLRHLGPFLARFRQADGDGLLAALHARSRLSTLQLAALEFVHGSLDRFLRSLAVLSRHGILLVLGPLRRSIWLGAGTDL